MKRVLTLLAFASVACKSNPPDPAPPADAGVSGTPVKVARVVRDTLALTVSGPGRTDALEQQKVRAPFKGILRQLRVADGDLVKDGQVVAVLVSQESENALVGAKALLRAATTPQQRSDGQRALELAQRGLVQTHLRAPEAGVVVSHGADEGSIVAEAQDVVSLAATDSFVFLANIAQTELSKVHPGQRATVAFSGQNTSAQGTVHNLLAAASPADNTAAVRIDLENAPHVLGMFGSATITVGQRRDVPVVPQAAVLRDDVSGEQRIALVVEGKAHWEIAKIGASQAGKVEIVAPVLKESAEVVTEGQVGLPEGAPVEVQP